MRILVSVWMVTYNHEKYIAAALESILMQKTNFDFEIVIGEDKSTDRTRSIIKEYQQQYPTIIIPIYHDVNVGAMRNAYEFTLPLCKGKYIACLEGDDYWTDPLKLQKQVDFLETNEQYSMCFTSRKVIDEVNKKEKIELVKNDFTVDAILTGLIPFTQTIVLRNKKEIFNTLATLIDDVGDRPLGYACLMHGKVKMLEGVTAVYRFSGSGAWSSKSLDDIDYINITSLIKFHDKLNIKRNNKWIKIIFKNLFIKRFATSKLEIIKLKEADTLLARLGCRRRYYPLFMLSYLLDIVKYKLS